MLKQLRRRIICEILQSAHIFYNSMNLENSFENNFVFKVASNLDRWQFPDEKILLKESPSNVEKAHFLLTLFDKIII